MNIEINAITVCVNYSHLFKFCMPNKRFFKRWLIVTVEEDRDTIALCKEHKLEYIFSKKLYNRQFSKGEAINEALDYIGYDEEWYCHIDADVLLPNNFPDTFPTEPTTGRGRIVGSKKLKCIDVDTLQTRGPFQHWQHYLDEPILANNLYCMGRVNVDEEEDFSNFDPQTYFDKSDQIVQRYKGYGYFQLWNMPKFFDMYPDLHHVYPSMSKNAGHDDWIFSKMFWQIISLSTYCIHLSPEKLNWDGKNSKLSRL